MTRFSRGDRVRILVDCPPGWAGAFGVRAGHAGIVTGLPMTPQGGSYGVLLDGAPDQMAAAFLESELTEEV